MKNGRPQLSFENTQTAFRLKNDRALRRAHWLFGMLRFQLLVRIGNAAVNWSIKLRLPVTGIIKMTVFDQFCGGETLSNCLPILDQMSEVGVKSILDYSVEGKETEGQFDAACSTLLELVDFSKKNPSAPFVVFKPTAVGCFKLFVKVSEGKALTEQENIEWKAVLQRYELICQKAFDNQIPVLIDAEESWMQKAADQLALLMMKKFNTSRAIVFNTAQLYRTDRLEYLKKLNESALSEGFFVGVKLVRGAYMEKERERAQKLGYASPICISKQATDINFDEGLRFMLSNCDRMSLYLGTHNEKSTYLAVQILGERNISSADQRVWFGQLYGMSDHISFNLGDTGYNVTKYVPFGPVREVVPYLTRRANENTSVAGQTGRELSLIRKEIERRRSLKKD